MEYLKSAFAPQKLLIQVRFYEYERRKSVKLDYQMLLMLLKMTCAYLSQRMEIWKDNKAETSSTYFHFTQLIQGERLFIYLALRRQNLVKGYD